MNKLSYKNINAKKCEEKWRKKQNNIIFRRDQKTFFRKLEAEEAHEGKIPEMRKFVKFCGGIWKKEVRGPYLPYMEKVRRHLKEKVSQVNNLNITFQKVKKEVRKRKG